MIVREKIEISSGSLYERKFEKDRSILGNEDLGKNG